MASNGSRFPGSSDDEPRNSGPAAKATLFCRECGHASRLDGDWLVRQGTSDYHVVCPDCGTVVIEQPGLELVA